MHRTPPGDAEVRALARHHGEELERAAFSDASPDPVARRQMQELDELTEGLSEGDVLRICRLYSAEMQGRAEVMGQAAGQLRQWAEEAPAFGNRGGAVAALIALAIAIVVILALRIGL